MPATTSRPIDVRRTWGNLPRRELLTHSTSKAAAEAVATAKASSETAVATAETIGLRAAKRCPTAEAYGSDGRITANAQGRDIGLRCRNLRQAFVRSDRAVVNGRVVSRGTVGGRTVRCTGTGRGIGATAP